MSELAAQKVEMIPIDSITVVNPRLRNRKIFKEIVANIAQIGLKRPITVTRRDDDPPAYDLICGQGRLEAFRELGQNDVPALVVKADPEDCLVASLVENCARRQHQAVDLLQDIGGMRERGYSDTEIAQKTGLSYDYVHAVGRLLERGEKRLLRAVEAGYLPISVAMQICLHEAYENKLLRGKNLLAARKLVELRQRTGKGRSASSDRKRSDLSSNGIVKVFEEDTARKRLMIKRSQATRNKLLFITEALRQLSSDETFMALAEDEELTDMPARIAERVADIPGAQ